MHAQLTPLADPSTALQGLTDQTAFFLLSICIRSVEGRRRIISEIVNTLNPSDKAEHSTEEQDSVRRAASNPYQKQPGFPAPHQVMLCRHNRSCNIGFAPSFRLPASHASAMATDALIAV